MIAIDRETGKFTWGEYVLDAKLSHDDFVQYNTQSTTIVNIITPDRAQERVYGLPIKNLENHRLFLTVVFYNRRLSGIYVERDYSYPEFDHDLDLKQLPSWVKTAQNLLMKHLGQPNQIEPGLLFDEDQILTAEEVQLLQSWHYEFEWGNAGFYYDGLQMPGEIYIHYDYHQFITDWDDLILEQEAYLENAHQHNHQHGKAVEITRAMIDLLRPHLDFGKVKPRVTGSGLMFYASPDLFVHVEPHGWTHRYRISTSHGDDKFFFVRTEDDLFLREMLTLLRK